MKQIQADNIKEAILTIGGILLVFVALGSCSAYLSESSDKSQQEYAKEYLEDNAIDYVRENYSISDVYSDSEIIYYINDNNMSLEDIKGMDISEYVSDIGYAPDEVFTEDELLEWYEEYTNGKG